MKTAIVILNWNGENYLKKFLPFLIKNTQIPNIEIVVADNASTDNSLKLIEKHFPTIRTIAFSTNHGFAKGYNKALFQLEADYFVLLNSDVEVSENWLPPLLEYMNEKKETAACQPKIRSYHHRGHFEYAGACGGFIDSLGFPFCRGRIFSTLEKDKGQYDTISSIFWASGACLLIRSEVFWEVGGFDAEFFAHMEEIDLCWRLQSRGYDIACIPQSTVFHIGGGSLKKESPFKTYLNFRNNLLMLYKNLPDNSLKKTMRCRFFLDYLAAIQMLVTGKFKNAKSIFKARYDYKRMRQNYALARRENLKSTKRKSIPEIYNKSIVFQYYLKKKKTFASLSFMKEQNKL